MIVKLLKAINFIIFNIHSPTEQILTTTTRQTHKNQSLQRSKIAALLPSQMSFTHAFSKHILHQNACVNEYIFCQMEHSAPLFLIFCLYSSSQRKKVQTALLKRLLRAFQSNAFALTKKCFWLVPMIQVQIAPMSPAFAMLG